MIMTHIMNSSIIMRYSNNDDLNDNSNSNNNDNGHEDAPEDGPQGA